MNDQRKKNNKKTLKNSVNPHKKMVMKTFCKKLKICPMTSLFIYKNGIFMDDFCKFKAKFGR